MGIILLAVLFIAVTMSLAFFVMKKTMIDSEGKETPQFYVSKNDDGDDVIHPLR